MSQKATLIAHRFISERKHIFWDFYMSELHEAMILSVLQMSGNS